MNKEKVKKIVNNYKYVFLMAAIFFLMAFVSITCYLIQSKKSYVTYVENSDVNYKVYINDNSYYDEDYLDMNNRYIASLIKNIEAYLSYQVDFKDNTKYDYQYEIVAETRVIDKENKDSIYNKKEVLFQSDNLNSKNSIKINKNLDIDYNKYNNSISKFVKLYELDETNCTLNIGLYLTVYNKNAVILGHEEVAGFSIPLTTKTVAINVSSNVKKQETNNLLLAKNKNYEGLLYIGLVAALMFVAYSVAIYIVFNRNLTPEQIYRKRLRKILTNYKSDIQIVSKDTKLGASQVIKIASFEDMLEISGTTRSPLLMIENKDHTGTFFIIPTNQDVIFAYALRISDIIAEKRGLEAPDYDILNINNKDGNNTKKYTKEFIQKRVQETINMKAIDVNNTINGNTNSNEDLYAQLASTQVFNRADIEKSLNELKDKKPGKKNKNNGVKVKKMNNKK